MLKLLCNFLHSICSSEVCPCQLKSILEHIFLKAKSEGFKNKKTEWQGIQATSLERKENTKNLALGYEFYSLGVNIIRPLENENIIASFEYSEQDFQKDHDIARYNISFGVHFNESENKFKDNSFILAGATLNEGERKILTNTTSSGTLNITDTYESFEIHTGKMFQNKSLLPNIGTNLSYSFTPSHTESKYYSWEDKHVANFSLDLNDEYNIENKKHPPFLHLWCVMCVFVLNSLIRP